MYVVTFYSYKGGVGRTLALMNTATALAQTGKRVLLVDFDLEAPGLCSYPDMCCGDGKPGIVEYVEQYLATNEAPHVANFIIDCSLDGRPIWLMPAGNQKEERYGARLAAIDWEDLYEHRSGYLMFEDLRQQWSEFQGQGFDYVLVDSRTGHTDVGGICTRQLPDAVVLQFLPNEQNIAGLVPVVESIRREERSPRAKKIEMLFCPSNVPHLDDEMGILARKLKESRERLGFEQHASCIHHYNSLELLEQALFTLRHPKSRLALEYAALKDAIIEGNLQDPEGAMKALQRATSAGPNAAERVYALPLEVIQSAHSKNPEVATYLAQAYLSIGADDEHLEALNVAIAHQYRLEQNLTARALAHYRRGDANDAEADLRRVLSLESGSGTAVVMAADILRTLQAKEWWRAVASSPALKHLALPEQKRLTQILMLSRASLAPALTLVDEFLARPRIPPGERGEYETTRVLILIALGRYRDAMTQLSLDRQAVLQSTNSVLIFNYAMAEWGQTKTPPKDLFERLLRNAAPSAEANFCQCLSLANYVVGEVTLALEQLERSRVAAASQVRTFSCWSYLYRDRRDFVRDLDEMKKGIDARAVLAPPAFLPLQEQV